MVTIVKATSEMKSDITLKYLPSRDSLIQNQDDVTVVFNTSWENHIRSNFEHHNYLNSRQKQSSRGVLRKRCSENMQQIYRRTPMPKSDFNKVALQLYIEIAL